ncbi:MAG: hypothetical protein EPO13_02350 [Actinomycetota bacterium]|nr:MAG: hypothetical protein EPO13_02350 [Actinomycetota bacterium]
MRSTDAATLRGAAVPTVIVGLVAIIVSAIAASGKGALGAVIGTAVVLVFFSAGQLALQRVLATRPELSLTVAVALYTVKIAVLFVLLLLFQDTTAFDTKAFALTVVACTLAWTTAEVVQHTRAKPLYVDPVDGHQPGASR